MDKNEEKIKKLLQERNKIKKRLEKIDSIFQNEKENEESWPGHASTRYQMVESDRQALLQLLSMVEEELKELGYKSLD